MNAIVLQCGGPTAVVNTTLAALVRRWRERQPGGVLWGGRYGLAALRSGDWQDLTYPETAWLERLEQSPGMALGGGRDRLDGLGCEAALQRLAQRDISVLFLIGGNGTMAAGWEIGARAAATGRRLRVVGVPKTIDNDIPATEVCPGFPSAARFAVAAVADIAMDVASMRGYEDVVLVEVMGRHAGWLAASTLLARSVTDGAPQVVLVPERPVRDDQFCADVLRAHAEFGICLGVVAEGVTDSDGTLLAQRAAARGLERDPAGQVILGRSGGPLPYLSALVRSTLGLRCREVRPDVLQRCSQVHVSPLDRTLAARAGTAAVDVVCDGPREPVMIALRETDGTWTTGPVSLERVRGERTVPPALLADPEPLRRLLG